MKASQPVAIVTGANRGLGRETAKQLLDQGYQVILTARDPAKAEQAVVELGFEHAFAARLDVTEPSTIASLVGFVEQTFGRLDVLVNNAAIHYDTWQSAEHADLEVVQQAMDTNVYGAWRMIQACLPLLLLSEHPRIVNVSSGAGTLSAMQGNTPAYSMSKIALNALTLMLSNQLKQEAILVNAVCPGWVATDMGGAGGRPVTEGASGIVWAATLPKNGPTGGFFRDGKPIEF